MILTGFEQYVDCHYCSQPMPVNPEEFRVVPAALIPCKDENGNRRLESVAFCTEACAGKFFGNRRQ